MDKEILFRSVIFFFALCLFMIGIFTLYEEITTVSDSILLGEISDINFGISDIIIPLLLLFLAYILFLLGSNWDNFFKRLSKTIIAIAIFCFTIFLVLYPINLNSNEIVSSIQPTLDYLFVDSFSDLLSGDSNFSNSNSINSSMLEEMNTSLQNITQLRNDCYDVLLINENILCSSIESINYENLILNMDEILETSEDQLLPFNLSSTFEKVSTLDEINSLIEQKTNSNNLFFILFIILMILAVCSYCAHFIIFKRELTWSHIPYYIFKINLIQFIPTFIIFLIIYLLLKSGKLINLIVGFLSSSESEKLLEIIPNLPIYSVLLNIMNETLILALWYLILSIFLYLIFYYLVKYKSK
jgi:hypothetical protein